MKNYIIYHNKDLDGFCSAAIIKKALIHNGETNIKMIGYDYGEDMFFLSDFADIRESDIESTAVYITDISFPAHVMEGLYRSLKTNVVWIDHHITAMEAAKEGGYSTMPGVRMIGDSAALLAWRYFNLNEKAPLVVDLVDHYDVWRKDSDIFPWSRVLNAQKGLLSCMKDPVSVDAFNEWDRVMSDDYFIGPIITSGRVLLREETRMNEVTCKNAYGLNFEGLLFAAVNTSSTGSRVLDSYATPKHQGLMVYRYTGNGWSVSMYGNERRDEKPDLSAIAKKYGGGGHHSACGFITNDIAMLLNK